MRSPAGCSDIPYVGSVGALDSAPEQFKGRKLYVHNANVTLMRTTPEENASLGRWLAAKLNRMTGPVRLLLPMGGISAIDVPGQPFHDPEADAALFAAIEAAFEPTASRQLVRLPEAINDPAFARAVVDAFHEIMPGAT